MANIFTSNQVNHVYVATALKTDNGKVVKSDAEGTISVQKDAEGNMYFMHRGKGGLTRSDLITNVMDVRYTPAVAMERYTNALYVSVNSAALDSSNVYAGEDYLLRLEFQNPVGMSPDHKYWKYGVVHAGASLSASNFYLAMAKSLAVNMSREAVQLVKVYVVWNNSGTLTAQEVTANSDITDSSTYSHTYTAIKIVEVEQDWVLGVKQEKPVTFVVNESTISNGSKDVYWADVTYSNGKKITGGLEVSESIETTAGNIPTGALVKNGKLAADLEYFAMGERADLYRNVGWPDVIPTKYLVDITKEYDMINIHYAYVGSNHAMQKSEKDITILVPRANTDSTPSTLGALTQSIKSYIDAIVNPTDSRYLTPATLFTGSAASYTDGHAAAIDKASDGTLSIVDGGAIG